MKFLTFQLGEDGVEWYIWAGWVIGYLIYLLAGDVHHISLKIWKEWEFNTVWYLKSTFTVGIYLFLLHKVHTEVKEERMVGVSPAM